MASDKRIQKAGEGSQQFQANTIINNYGITEERARAICAEMSQKAIADCTEEAINTANERVKQFEDIFIPRFEQVEKGFSSFSDPSFQVLLRKAQLTAACSGSAKDYKVLSELLIHRAKNRGDVKKKASITKAVEILYLIDEDSLLCLTLFDYIKRIIPTSGVIHEGLSYLDSIYGKYDLDSLPSDYPWLDNLEVVGAVTVSSIGSQKKYNEYFSEKLSGYVCAGIKKDSDEHVQAKVILKEAGLPDAVLIDNELIDGYSRLVTPTLESVSRLVLNQTYKMPASENPIRMPFQIITLNEQQKDAVHTVISLYEKSAPIVNEAKNNFSTMLKSYPSINKTMEWWDSLDYVIELTAVGRVIAHTNAKSIDPYIPDID